MRHGSYRGVRVGEASHPGPLPASAPSRPSPPSSSRPGAYRGIRVGGATDPGPPSGRPSQQQPRGLLRGRSVLSLQPRGLLGCLLHLPPVALRPPHRDSSALLPVFAHAARPAPVPPLSSAAPFPVWPSQMSLPPPPVPPGPTASFPPCAPAPLQPTPPSSPTCHGALTKKATSVAFTCGLFRQPRARRQLQAPYLCELYPPQLPLAPSASYAPVIPCPPASTVSLGPVNFSAQLDHCPRACLWCLRSSTPLSAASLFSAPLPHLCHSRVCWHWPRSPCLCGGWEWPPHICFSSGFAHCFHCSQPTARAFLRPSHP